MLRSILVPVDGSSFSEQSLELASHIADRAAASLDVVLVHVPYSSLEMASNGAPPVLVETISDDVAVAVEDISDEPNISKDIFHHERQYLHDLQRRLTLNKKTRVETHHLKGNIVNQLEEEAVNRKVDLVVMTTHGSGTLSRFWLGSVADELLRRVSVPVLLIRPDHQTPSSAPRNVFRRILIPLDGSALSESILEPAFELGNTLNSEVTLLRVVPMPPNFDATSNDIERRLTAQVQKATAQAKSYLEKIGERFATKARSVQTRVVADSLVASSILHEANEIKADLIALATHGRSGLPRVFFGSVADKVLRGASTPVLLVSRNWQVAHGLEK